MKLRNFLATLALVCVAHGANAGLIIDSSVGKYEISTITGTFDDNSAFLMDQVWWDKGALAAEFAGLVGDSFGVVNYGLDGPWFAWAIDTDSITAASYYITNPSGPEVLPDIKPPSDIDGTFAYATPVNAVPLPAAAWLFGSALLGLGAIKRRKI